MRLIQRILGRREEAAPPTIDATHTVVLRLDPKLMADPDLEIRAEIEELLRTARQDISFFDDGYGFARNSDAMLITYATPDAEGLVEALVKVLEEETILGNRLGPAAMVAVGPRVGNVQPGSEFAHHKLVYPPSEAGKALPD